MNRVKDTHPRGLTWNDVKDTAPLLNPVVDGIQPNGVTNPMDYFSQSIASEEVMNHDQRDAARNNFLQLLIRDQDFQRMSPQAQLERLMATGMSRAQAMQLLSSSGASGSGGGSSVVPQMAGNSELAAAEKLNAISNLVHAANETAQTIGQLFMIGSSIGLNKSTMQLQAQQAMYYSQQSQALAIGNRMAKDEYDAMGQAAAAIQVLSNYQKKTGFETPDNINDWLDHVSKTPDVTLKLWQEKHKVDLANPFYYSALKTAYENYRKGDFDLSAYRRQTVAQTRLTELGIDNIVAGIAKIGTEIETYQRSWENIKAQVNQANANAAKLSNESNRIYLETENDFTPDLETGISPYRAKAKGEGDLAYYAGLLSSMDYQLEYNYKYPIMLEDCLIELSAWQGLSDAELAKRRDMYVQNYDNQQLACFILATKLANIDGFQEAHPSLNAVFDLYQSYGLLQDLVGGASKAIPSFYFGRKSVNFTKTVKLPM